MRLPFRSATSRMILAHFALVAVSTAIVLGYVFWSTKSLIDQEVREVVQAELRGLATDYARLGALGLATAIDSRIAGGAAKDAVYLLTGPSGRRIAGNLASWPESVKPGEGWVEIELARTDSGELALVTAASFRLPGGERLLVGRDARVRRTFDQTLLKALWSALAVMAALTLLTGWLLSRFVRRQVDAVAETARGIMRGDFERRVPLSGAGDEFDRLSSVLNEMLERIDLLVGELRMVTDSVAHDLRSPLTRLRSDLAASLDESLDPEMRKDRVARAIDEADRVLTAFTELVSIARAEAGMGREQFLPVDLAELGEELAELYGPTAEEAGATLRFETCGSVMVSGHRQLMAQAVSNLVENALKHAPDGGEIALTVSATETEAALSVADRGPGVPAASREAVLKRFTQLDPSRGKGGSGLGLALVAAVAKMHGGSVTLDDNAPGLIATLTLPRIDEAAADA